MKVNDYAYLKQEQVLLGNFNLVSLSFHAEKLTTHDSLHVRSVMNDF